MTKTFCDRCKKEIVKHAFHVTIDDQINGDLCGECFSELGDFLDGKNFGATKIDNYGDPIFHHENNHGIERTTFGAK